MLQRARGEGGSTLDLAGTFGGFWPWTIHNSLNALRNLFMTPTTNNKQSTKGVGGGGVPVGGALFSFLIPSPFLFCLAFSAKAGNI